MGDMERFRAPKLRKTQCPSLTVNDSPTFVLAGTLDDPAAFKPTTEMYWSKVQPWIRTSGEQTRFPEMPN
jgi:hypothetical protein